MDNNIFNEIGTTLDLNGPILSYSEQPTGATGIGTTVGATGGASVSFTGIATGVDPGTGYLSYQWYEQDVGKLSDSTYVTGAASTGPVGTAATLTISNLITPTDNQRKFYLVTDYVASAYGTGRSTGNAWNEPLSSGIATSTVTPLIEIIAQPAEGVQTLINATPDQYLPGQFSTISVDADLTDSYFADDLQYQWYLNGELAVDGVKTVETTTSSAIEGDVEKTYTSNATHTTPSTAKNIVITVAGAPGGNGGFDAGGPGGTGGGGRAGRFDFTSDGEKALDFRIGGMGNGGTSGQTRAGGRWGASNLGASGGHGGGAGSRGWSGGGGGGGGACVVKDSNAPGEAANKGIIVAGGGGGGGGGSWRVGGEPGSDGNTWTSSTDYVSMHDGDNGETKSGDGGGGGGGGGGAGTSGADGGVAGADRSRSSGGGSGGRSQYSWADGGLNLTQQWVTGKNDNAYVHLKYTATTVDEVTTIKKTTLSGTQTNTLKIACDTVGVQTCQCKITSATASNSPIWTDVSNFVTTTTADAYNVHIEGVGIGQTATLTDIDLANGDYTFYTTEAQVSTGSINKYYSIYSPHKDLDVEMDLYGGKGDDKGSYTGGEGGYSRIRFTMVQNTEYVIVGLSSDLNAPFLYRQGELMACVGQGGDAGISGDGGNGGGVSNAGQDGQGRESGIGGVDIAAGTIGANGTFGSQYPAGTVYSGDSQATGQDGGRTIRCTKGVFWAEQGISACNDITESKWYGPGGVGPRFRLPDGTDVTNSSSSITRGFKAGYNIMETAGAKDANGGVGGNGATGGSGGSQGGGGGGSGYNDGSITVVDTQQSGSTEDAKVVLRVVT